VYNHCNICNISIYFCNIHLKRLQRISEILRNICLQHALSAKLGSHAGRALHSEICLCDRGGEGGRQRAGGCAAPSDRAHAVPLVSGARGGGDNNSRVGAALRGEAAAAVWARQRWRARPTGGTVERKTCGRRGGARLRLHEFFIIYGDRRGRIGTDRFLNVGSTYRGIRRGQTSDC
jgi:hypothetical protein